MLYFRLFFITSVISLMAQGSPLEVSKIQSKPTLGIVIVIDQLRSDALTRYQSQFSKNGFAKLINDGVYFPFADHGILNCMTGPGHAAILTGAYPYRHGICSNTNFDHTKNKDESCVYDANAKIVSGSGNDYSKSIGISAVKLNASTLGDELKNAGPNPGKSRSKVISLAIKDRAAIFLGGKQADQVFWLDDKNFEWITSSFYQSNLPNWLIEENKVLSTEKSESFDWGKNKSTKIQKATKASISTEYGVEVTLRLAQQAVIHENLGENDNEPDLLLISLTSHDYLGHQHGPDTDDMKELTLQEDRLIGQFLNFIDQKVGLDKTFVVLTGDHGIPPSQGWLKQNRLSDIGKLDRGEKFAFQDLEFIQVIENELNLSFGNRKIELADQPWVAGYRESQIHLNYPKLEANQLSIDQAYSRVQAKVEALPHVFRLISRDRILMGTQQYPADFGKIVERTVHERSGDFIISLEPYYWTQPSQDETTHMTHYSYDRYVPLIFMGPGIKNGQKMGDIVNIQDIAPTLATYLEVMPPTQNEGRVLSEIFK